MSSTLLILFGGVSPEAPLNWARVSRSTGEILQQGVLNTLDTAPASTPADTVLIIPGSEAQLKSVKLSAGSEAQARAAAAYLFDGALAIETENAIFAMGAETGGRRLVAASDRRRLQGWIDRCAAANANPGAIHLDSAIWPVRAGVVQIINLGDHAIIVGGEQGSFAIEADLVSALLPAWIAQAPGSIAAVETFGIDAIALATRLPQPAPALTQLPDQNLLSMLCRAALAPPAHAPNLRQGEFALVKRKAASVGAWGFAAGLAIAVAALQLGVMAADGYRDAQAAAELSVANEAAFLQLRPGTKRVANLRAQVTAALNAAARPALSPAISNSNVVAGVLRSHPDVRLDEVRSDGPSRLVTLRFSSAQSPALDAAMTDLSASIANLKLGQMQTNDGRVNLTVSVEAS